MPAVPPAAPVVEPTYEDVVQEHGAAIGRLLRGYERDQAKAQDLAQEVLVAIWRALPSFEGRSSVKTWALRIAHNVAMSHLAHARRDVIARWVAIEDVELAAVEDLAPEGRLDVKRVLDLVLGLRPLDRQVILLWLEGFTTDEIAEVTGLASSNVGVKVHRIKALLAQKMETT